MDFVHLHVHSNMSMQDALPSAGDLTSRASELGMKAMALTDHGNLHGIPKFDLACREAGIKPIFGCEFYMTRSMVEKTKEQRRASHLTILAKNETGWKNLVALSTMSYYSGFYYQARIDEEQLFKHSGGLIVLSGCQSGMFARACLESRSKAEQVAARYREAFGHDYYLEIVAIDQTTDRLAANLGAEAVSLKLGIPVVVTNDVHYLHPEDSAIRFYLTKTKMGKDQKGFRCDELWLKSAEEIWKTFPRCWAGTGLKRQLVQGGMERTIEIAEKVTEFKLDSGQKISEIPANIDCVSEIEVGLKPETKRLESPLLVDAETDTTKEFNAEKSEQEKVEGLELATSNKGEYLEIARAEARRIALSRPDRCCWADLVQERLDKMGIDLGNAAGSIFRNGEWTHTKDFEKSAQVQCHGRIQYVWKLN